MNTETFDLSCAFAAVPVDRYSSVPALRCHLRRLLAVHLLFATSLAWASLRNWWMSRVYALAFTDGLLVCDGHVMRFRLFAALVSVTGVLWRPSRAPP